MLMDEDDEGNKLKNPVRGPLWVSTGAWPILEGMETFQKRKVQHLLASLKKLKQYKTEVDNALDNDDEVKNPEVAKMSVDELYEVSAEVDEEISACEDRVKHAKQQLKLIRSNLDEEKPHRGVKQSLYRVHGITLKVYENGKGDGEFSHFFNLTEASKGMPDNVGAEHYVQKLLEELSNCKGSSGANKTLSIQAKKLFDQFGNEVKDVRKLENDSEVWLSFGEPFIEPFTYCLQVFVDKAVKLTGPNGEDRFVREALMGPEQEDLARNHSKWEATIGFPPLFEMDEMRMLEYDEMKVQYLLENAEIDGRSHFLLLKELHDSALYPEISFAEKINTKKQVWSISKTGQISCKAYPQMCLAVGDTRVEGKLFNKDIAIAGYVVMLQKKMVGNPSQTWSFSETDAVISCDAQPQLILTYLGNKAGDEEGYSNNTPVGSKNGERVCLIVSEPLPRKDASAQR